MNGEKVLEEVDLRRIGARLFLIPSYQRGYRWTAENVEALLDDLLEFCEARKSSPGLKYCLQPIVLQNVDGGERIVDGQQRITTLSLLLYVLSGDNIGKIKWDLTYEEMSVAGETVTLKNLLLNGGDDSINWYFMETVIKAIKDWAKEHKEGASNILKVIDTDSEGSGGVFVLEYRFNNSCDRGGQRTFSEINDGQTPLTSSELIKALFLVKENRLSDMDRQSIAKEWELIETQLREPKFWSIWNTKKYEETYTRIDLLFSVVCKAREKDRSGDRLYIFHATEKWLKDLEKKEGIKRSDALERLWEEVLRCYWWMMSCFEDCAVHNYLGWIAWNTQDSVAHIYEDVWKKRAKCVPADMLPSLKRHVLRKFEEVSLDLTTYRYDNESNPSLVRVLSLVNVLYANKKAQKLPFEYINCDHSWTWQIEHIDSKTTNENDHNREGHCLEDKDVIQNLALLDSCTNEGYGNAPFTEKRMRIIQINDSLSETRRPIMPCTLSAFTKSISDRVDRMDIWDKDVAGEYLKKMQKLIYDFKTEVKNHA